MANIKEWLLELGLDYLPIVEVLGVVGQTIAYFPTFGKVFDSATTGLFLSQFIFWIGKEKDSEGWIYKTQADIERETGLSRSEQERARRQLVESGAMEEKRRGLPAKMHYRFNQRRIGELVVAWYELQEKPKEKPAKPEAETKPDPLLFRMKESFVKFNTEHTEIHYVFSKARNGGKDWYHLKLLAASLKETLVDWKKRKKNPPDPEPEKVTDDEIVTWFDLMLTKLPDKWKKAKAGYSPAILSSNYNEIINVIKNANVTSNTANQDLSKFA